MSILKKCLTFAAVNELAMTYQTTIAQQRNFDFFAFFSALYLVVSDILLTHTHTHTHTHNWHLSSIFSFTLRVREACRNARKQRTSRSFLCSLFVPICELSRKQNKNVLSTEITVTNNCNSLIIVSFLSLISWAGSSEMLSACREGRGQATIKDK